MSAPITFQRLATEDIFQLLGIQNISDEEKEQILEQMHKTVLARVYAAVYSELSPDEREELDAQSSETVIQYLTDKGFDMEVLVHEEAVRYRVELAQVMEYMTAPDPTKSAVAA